MSTITSISGQAISNRLSNITKKSVNISRNISTGKIINNACDGVAELGISERMKTQIKGFDMNKRNIQDGISLINVAEGAMSEIDNMLQRMRELSIQSINDTNTDADRALIENEIVNLKDAIKGMANNTTFNEIKVLQGSYMLVDSPSGEIKEQSMEDLHYIQEGTNTVKRWGAELDFGNVTNENKSSLIGKSFNVTCSQNCNQVFEFSFTTGNTVTSTISGTSLYIEIGIDDLLNGTQIIDTIMNEAKNQQAALGYTNPNICQIGHANAMAQNGSKIIFYSLNSIASGTTPPTYAPGMGLIKAEELEIDIQNGIKIQTGPNVDQTLEMFLPTISLGKLRISKVSVATSKKAEEALSKLDYALEYLSSERTRMGSYYNRLEYTHNAVATSHENLSKAFSTIVDTDIAKEITKSAKLNILSQSAQAMLAQSNMSLNRTLQILQ